MIRLFGLACLVFGLAATVSAEEYILHLEEVGYVDQPVTNKNPKETTIRRIELLVEPNKPFRLKTQVGKETITFSGKIEPYEEKNEIADYRIEASYRWELDTGLKVIVAENKWEPLPSIRGFNTTLGLKLGQPVTAAGMTTKNDQPGKQLMSDVRYLLILNRHNPIVQR